MRKKGRLAALCSAGVLGLAMAPAPAQDRLASLPGRQAASSGAPLAYVHDTHTLDPVMQAIIIAMAARILREAAASPDPVAALAESVERSAVAALASPETVRLVEALTGQAFKDVPEELRQAIVAFAVSAYGKMRRDLLQGRRTP